ncbi:zinc finger HIT domain-containing protein 2 [Histomonas meleagridis]|uniref:zinc finger HIT domain-containing protein 2 n=1 Tax=Histomonas meleagridis TaxID=135588 RepID=UPI003559BDD2|nr:zinc finger HIT domain-containing protein 2 [Histomonas meleagridis]KAH0797753.1 zinc finger HIT domain-containing protein 2 [Histomonas meleagridis]
MVRTLENAENNDPDHIPINTEVEPWTAWWEDNVIVNAPKPESPPPPRVSPLLPFHLVDILYSYCYTMRLYNGDVSFDFDGACDVILTISTVLSTTTVHLESVKSALKNCIEQTRRPDIFVAYQWQVEVVHDVEMCLTTQSHVFRALSESIAITREANEVQAMRKLQFFFAWSQSLNSVQLEKLRNDVHQFYTSLNALLFDVRNKEIFAS